MLMVHPVMTKLVTHEQKPK